MNIRVGIIGFGMSAQTFHLPLLSALPEFEIRAFCSSQGVTLAELWPDAHCVATVDELVALDNVDLVIVTSPSGLHFQHAQLALKAGKHVVVEKPFTLNCKEAESLFALAQSQQRVLTAFHNRRWDGDFLTVQRLLATQKLGQVRVFESHFDRFRPLVRNRWREQAGAGSGILYDLGPHLIDQALCLFGLPNSVSATIQQQRQKAQVDDYVHIQLHYEGLEVILHADMLSASPNPRFKVQGDKGTYIKQGLDPQENQLKQGKSPLDKDFAMTPSNEHGCLYMESEQRVVHTEKGGYLSFYNDLACAIADGKSANVSQESIIHVMHIIDLAKASNAQGQRVPAGVFAQPSQN